VTPDGSVSFDRAASYYDATRVLPPEAARATISTLVGELRERGRVLEIGVGTGRIAAPVADAGIDVYGVDISRTMLEKLRSKTQTIHVALADAMLLPFDDHTFGAAYGVHVLHLMAGWADAVRELVRVVKPGGVLLFDIGNADPAAPGGWTGIAREIEVRFMREAGIERRHPGITRLADLDDLLNAAGATARDLPPAKGSMELAPGVMIQMLEGGLFSFTWGTDQETLSRAAEAVRAWARSDVGDIDRPQRIETTVSWRAYDLR
jgi:SAM-dependent methyltransferase